MEIAAALLLGIALAAACGFRIFVPLLVMGLAHQAGQLTLAPSMAWLASWPAIAALSAATVLEIAGYYVPWIDNLLDSVATPAAFIAGTLAAAAAIGQIHGLSPLWTWALAAITGGGTATVVQGSTVLVRAASSLTTGGLANPVVSTTEAASATAISILAIVLPIAAGLLLVLMALIVVMFIVRRRRRITRAMNLSAQPMPAA